MFTVFPPQGTTQESYVGSLCSLSYYTTEYPVFPLVIHYWVSCATTCSTQLLTSSENFRYCCQDYELQGEQVFVFFFWIPSDYKKKPELDKSKR